MYNIRSRHHTYRRMHQRQWFFDILPYPEPMAQLKTVGRLNRFWWRFGKVDLAVGNSESRRRTSLQHRQANGENARVTQGHRKSSPPSRANYAPFWTIVVVAAVETCISTQMLQPPQRHLLMREGCVIRSRGQTALAFSPPAWRITRRWCNAVRKL